MSGDGGNPTPIEVMLDTHAKLLDRAGEDLRRSTVVRERIEDAAGVEVGRTPSTVVYTENKLELLHYEPLTEHQHPVPILIV